LLSRTLSFLFPLTIRYSILNARLAAGAVSGGGVDQAYDEFQQCGEADIPSPFDYRK
jgi:hypothetical protein